MAHRLKQFGGLVDRHQQESPETEISSGVPKKLDVHPPGLLKELAEQSRALVAAKAELKQARQQHMAAIEEANDWVDDLWALLDEKGSQIRDTQAKLEESEDKNATLTVKLEEKEKMIIRLRNEAGFYKTSHQSKIDFLSKRVKELEAACSKQRPVSFYPSGYSPTTLCRSFTHMDHGFQISLPSALFLRMWDIRIRLHLKWITFSREDW